MNRISHNALSKVGGYLDMCRYPQLPPLFSDKLELCSVYCATLIFRAGVWVLRVHEWQQRRRWAERQSCYRQPPRAARLLRRAQQRRLFQGKSEAVSQEVVPRNVAPLPWEATFVSWQTDWTIELWPPENIVGTVCNFKIKARLSSFGEHMFTMTSRMQLQHKTQT